VKHGRTPVTCVAVGAGGSKTESQAASPVSMSKKAIVLISRRCMILTPTSIGVQSYVITSVRSRGFQYTVLVTFGVIVYPLFVRPMFTLEDILEGTHGHLD